MHFKLNQFKYETNPYNISIPSERESAFQVGRIRHCHTPIRTRFNSLRAGKCISRKLTRRLERVAVKFQFPPNGKVHFKYNFERDTFRLQWKFQFPPSGKVHFKRRSQSTLPRISICFNSLRAGKCISSQTAETRPVLPPRFNSLRAGKCISSQTDPTQINRTNGVSIPSERESAFQVSIELNTSRLAELFQFPPSGKVHFKSVVNVETLSKFVSFNSLRAGKCISRKGDRVICTHLPKFQFPPSGKVHFKESLFDRQVPTHSRFNSLRAGKCISSLRHRLRHQEALMLCFNSLRAGKCISSHEMIKELNKRTSVVSIPSERESAFQGCVW